METDQTGEVETKRAEWTLDSEIESLLRLGPFEVCAWKRGEAYGGDFVDFTEKEPVDWSKKPRISFFSQPYGDGGSSTTGFFVAGGDQDRLDRACRELGIPSGSILSDDDMRRVFAYFGCKTAW